MDHAYTADRRIPRTTKSAHTAPQIRQTFPPRKRTFPITGSKKDQRRSRPYKSNDTRLCAARARQSCGTSYLARICQPRIRNKIADLRMSPDLIIHTFAALKDRFISYVRHITRIYPLLIY